MNEGLQGLVAYRLQRAVEALEEARLLQKAAHWNACANRLYYAAFYAVSALLVGAGHSTAKHSGIKALFNQHYVKSGTLKREEGRLYNRLFDLRQEGDYIDFVYLDPETVEPLIEKTAAFIEKIRSLTATS
jgi:uncharacterized protein (UPF0332 family)